MGHPGTGPNAPVVIRAASDFDARALRDHVAAAWHADSVIAHGERIYPALLPGLVVVAAGRIVGHASYRVDGGRCELTSLNAEPRHAGIGTLLLEAVVEAARRAGCHSIWLTTTNDNLDALRFYQRRGFRLAALRQGAVDRARETLKPELPAHGEYGIPMQDELDLEADLSHL